jgi:pantoate--beta-alanine ligase
MGALHSGHLALIHNAAKANDLVVVSIFVNPTQFNNAEDLKRYPRDIEKDKSKLQEVPCDVLFFPEVSEMYPEKVESLPIDLGGLDIMMEGAHRPGHFDGVATIVSRFFEIIGPDEAFFGEKDFQQLQIIRHVSRALGFKVKIVAHPIERNEGGLALSSRNELLSPEDKEHSLAIIKNLKWARKHQHELSPVALTETITANFKNGPLALEYVEIVNQENLKKIETWQEAQNARIFIAAHISGVRLIDNLLLF